MGDQITNLKRLALDKWGLWIYSWGAQQFKQSQYKRSKGKNVEATYTATQAGKIIGVTSVSILRYINQGRLQAQRQQHGLKWKYRITETELRRFSNQHQTQFDLAVVAQE